MQALNDQDRMSRFIKCLHLHTHGNFNKLPNDRNRIFIMDGLPYYRMELLICVPCSGKRGLKASPRCIIPRKPSPNCRSIDSIFSYN